MKLTLSCFSAMSVLGLGALLAAACGGDTTSNISGPGPDGGTSTGGTTSAGGSNSSGNVTGNGAAPPAPDFVPDVDNDTEISDLDDDQFDELCDEIRDYAGEFAASEEIQEFQCRATGIQVALLLSGALDNAGAGGGDNGNGIPNLDLDIDVFREDCQSAYDQCIATAAPAESPAVGDCQQPDASCDITVGEVEECLDDLGRLQRQLGGAFPSCEEATVANLLASFLLLQGQSMSAPCDNLNRCDPDTGAAGAPGE